MAKTTQYQRDVERRARELRQKYDGWERPWVAAGVAALVLMDEVSSSQAKRFYRNVAKRCEELHNESVGLKADGTDHGCDPNDASGEWLEHRGGAQ